VLTYIGSASASTLSNVAAVVANIGAAAADRLVVAVFSGLGFNSAATAVSIGSAAALVNQAQANGMNECIGCLNVPSGTTATVSVTYAAVGDGLPVAIDIYTITGLLSFTPTGSDQAAGAGVSSLTTPSLSVSAGGVAIIGSGQQAAASTTDIVSGSSGSFTQDHPNFQISGFSLNTIASATGLAAGSANFTATWNGSGNSALVAAAWR